MICLPVDRKLCCIHFGLLNFDVDVAIVLGTIENMDIDRAYFTWWGSRRSQ